MAAATSNQGVQPPQIVQYYPASEIRFQKLTQQLRGNATTAGSQGSADLHIAYAAATGSSINLQACKQGCLLAAKDAQVCKAKTKVEHITIAAD
jgi:hypothetical protein